MTSRRQLTEWLGEDATDSEALITTLHELLTGAYELETFKSDVARYEIEEEPDDISTLEKKYDVLSPDGFSIHMEDTYDSPEAAKAALIAWIKNYERQGYYSSGRNGRIPLDEIEGYCTIVPI